MKNDSNWADPRETPEEAHIDRLKKDLSHWKTRALKAEEALETAERNFNALGERCWQACCMHIEPAVADTYPFAIWDRTRLLELALAEIHVKDSVRTKECNILTQENRSQAAEIAKLKEELTNIANANVGAIRSDFGPDADRQFRLWAQNCARVAIGDEADAALREKDA